MFVKNSDISPSLSIIVATYNRAHILSHCLQSLVEQNVPQDTFEVIVINNNSSDNTQEIVQCFCGKIKNLKLIEEKKQGLSHARNAGIAAAQTPWIASLDDDAKAHTNWVQTILEEIEKDTFDCFGGPYLAWHHYGPAPHWFSSEWETSKNRFNFYGILPEKSGLHPTGGNCVFRKKLVEDMGGFDTNLGMTGNTCAYGEETQLFENMRNAGFRLGSVPSLLIDHCVLPHKYTLKWRIHSAYAHGYSLPSIEPEYATLKLLPRRLAGIFKRIIFIPMKLRQEIKAKHAWQRIFLESSYDLIWSIGLFMACLHAQLPKTRKQ